MLWRELACIGFRQKWIPGKATMTAEDGHTVWLGITEICHS